MKKSLFDLIGGMLLFLLLIYVWFHKGYVIASGESGLFFYEIENVIKFYGQTWFSGAIGFPGNGIPLIDLPLFYSISLLRQIQISYVFIQASTYYVLQLTGFISIYGISYLLGNKLPLNRRRVVSLLASLFYLFNQINIVIVLNRMQYPFLFSYALIPLGLLLLILAIQKRQLIYAFIIPVVAFFLATSFSEISSIALFWIVLLSFTLFHFIFNERKRKFFSFAIKFFSIDIIIWLVINSWWILPMFKTLGGSPYVTKLTYNPNGDLDILVSLSQVLGNLSYDFRLMHQSFYMWMKYTWNGYYQNPLIIFLTFIPPLLVFGSLLVKKKPPYYYFFLFMSLVTVFVMKGVANPFGALFQFLFTHLRILEAFRNPFEKISVILPLFYSLPFAVGVYGLYEYIKKCWSIFLARSMFVAISVICFVILVIPLWNRWVFTGSTVPSNNTKVGFKVEVPDYYTQANKWLQGKKTDSRVIALPIGEEGITYNWKYGYNGVELSNGLFSNPFISYCTTIQFLCEITHDIQPTLLDYPDDFWKILSPLNAKYVMLRKDTNYQVDQMQNPDDLQKQLTVAQKIQKEKSFGPLTFYSGNDIYSTPKIFAATQGIYLDGETSFIDAVPLANFQKDDIYFTSDNLLGTSLNHSHQVVLQANEFVPPQLKISEANALLELPYVRFLPGSPFYLWTRMREDFDNFLAGDSDLPNRVVESDKRLVESYKLLQLGKVQEADNTMKKYISLLQRFYSSNVQFAQDKEKEDLLRQKYVLSDALSLANQHHDINASYSKASHLLALLLRRMDLEPLMPSDLTTNRVYTVSVPSDGEYFLKISKQNYNAYYPMDTLNGVIDGKNNFSAPVTSADNFVTLGTFHLLKGDHQITIMISNNTNLLPIKNLALTTENAPSGIQSKTYTFPVKLFESDARYILSFDYKITSGNPFQVLLWQDGNHSTGNSVNNYNALDYTGHKDIWYHYETTIVAKDISHSAKLLFYIYPGNTCKKNSRFLQNCNDRSYSKRYNVVSSADVKNISFVREDIGNVFLTKEQSIQTPYKAPKITYTEENPARYLVKITEATTPFYLTFLEAYHPLWKLYYLENGKDIPVNEQNHLFVNSYANAWLLDKKGSYTMLLEFAPQSFFEIGTKISIAAFSILVIGIGMYLLKRRYRKMA